MTDPLTLTDLSKTVGATLKDLDLTLRCYARSSAYVDYVACVFYVPEPTVADVAVIKTHFEALARKFDWLIPEPVILNKSNRVMVTLMKSTTISTSDARMPI